MKAFNPRSLIQVHYHNRPGGVHTVMERYAAAFDRCAKPERGVNLICCKNDLKTGVGFAGAELLSMPECEYRSFIDKNAFVHLRNSLQRKLLQAIEQSHVAGPVCVVGHNLTLGKNCALSSAFAEAARAYDTALGDIRFFSVIHDFAEEGRTDCMRDIERLRGLGIAMWDDLFPKTGTMVFIVPHQRNYKLLKTSGFNVALLNNPLSETAFSINLKNASAPKTSSAPKCFIPNAPTLFYPSRIIPRKNIFEAILLSNIIIKANLFLGSPGPSSAHKKLFARIKTLCNRHALPVVFIKDLRRDDTCFPHAFYGRVDACVSTSIAEGFGYAFYESWINNKAIVGRKPLDFSPAFGLKMPFLYERLPIPVTWASVDALARKYYDRSVQFSYVSPQKSFPKFKREFEAVFIKDGTMDFSCLDEQTQLNILHKLLGSPSMVMEWEKLCGKELSRIRNSVFAGLQTGNTFIRLNRARLLKETSDNNFAKDFARCFFKTRQKGVYQNRYKEIGRHFGDISRMRLLMAPDDCPPCGPLIL
jgi:glycosyltransferase involved in cell wall biosynthesis/CRISPR/Cas system-associated endoribonuclease Cas2